MYELILYGWYLQAMQLKPIRLQKLFKLQKLYIMLQQFLSSFLLYSLQNDILFLSRYTIVCSQYSYKCQSCISTMAYCQTCSSSNVCTSCFNNTYLKKTNTCQYCYNALFACSICTNSTFCDQCYPSYYYLNLTLHQCFQCFISLSDCVTCNSSTICTSCSNTSYLNSSINLCLKCAVTLTDCKICINQTLCTECFATSFLNSSNKCQFCNSTILSCISCSSSTFCLLCAADRYISPINSTVNQCILCSVYLPSCISCLNSSYCTSCINTTSIILADNACKICSQIMPHCSECLSPLKCIHCSNMYILHPTYSFICQSCSSFMYGCILCTSTNVCTSCMFGKVVSNGCSSIPGCIQVGQHLPQQSYCNQCDSAEYFHNPINGICICRRGRIVNQYCTEIIGCTKTVKYNSTVYCTGCNLVSNFVLLGSTCVCREHFYLINQKCQEICGDGLLFNLACDDGNSIDGDGCSSACKIESNYFCENGSSNSSSSCIYKGSVELFLGCIYNTQGSNMLEITVKIQPNILRFQLSNLDGKIKLFTSANLQLSSYLFKNNLLSVFINFKEDIIGKKLNVSLQFDKRYISSSSAIIQFTFPERDCLNDKIVFEKNIQDSFKKLLNRFSEILCITALFCWLFGSYSHKMIGVQTLHTIQIFFISLSFASNYKPVISKLYPLKNILTVFEDKIMKIDFLQINPYKRLGFTSDFISNMFTIMMIEGAAIIVYFVIYTLITFWLADKKKLSESQKAAWIAFPYRFLIFPLFIGFYLSYSISLLINNQRSIRTSQTSVLQSVFMTFITLITILVFFHQYRSYLMQRPQSISFKLSYVVYYLCYIFIVSFALNLCFLGFLSQPLYLISTLEFLYTIFVLWYQPYSSSFHQFCLFVNQFVILSSIGWMIAQELIEIDSSLDNMIALIFLILITIVLLLSFIRTIYQLIKSFKQNSINKNNINDIKEAKFINTAVKQQVEIGKNISMLLSEQLRYEKIHFKDMEKPIIKKIEKTKFLKAKLLKQFELFQKNQIEQWI